MAPKSRSSASAEKPAASEQPMPNGSFELLSEAIESGAGLPAVARAAAAALGASVALLDRSSAVLAVAAASSAEEEKLLDGGEDSVAATELRVADAVVGELRYRPRGRSPVAAPTLRIVAALLGLELERARAPEWASDDAAQELVVAALERRLDDSDELAARAAELGADLASGGGVVFVRARPHAAQPGEWRRRVLMLTLRAARAAGSGALAAELGEPGEAAEVAAIVPGAAPEQIARAAEEAQAELLAALPGFDVTIGFSRAALSPAEIYRAGKEALLALNVAEAEGRSPLAFEETGSYRLLLPAMSEDPAELVRFYEETVAPLAAYDDQYETELVSTIEAYLENDGNVTPTAERLFTHRHTVRYRLERVRELSGHDLSSTEGREKLGLGLKAMRVLGIPAPGGPATEGRGRRTAEE